MAKHKATKDFDYAHDGLKSKKVKKGEVVEVHDHLVAGLVSEGYIADGGAAETLSKVAGKAVKDADLGDVVHDTKQVKDEINRAEAGISDGHIGGPEAAAIVHEHKVIPTLPAVGENVPENDVPAHDKKKS